MSRYFTRRRETASFFDDDPPLLPGISVTDHVAVFTGLLDAKEEEIWRNPNPMGFGRDAEW